MQNNQDNRRAEMLEKVRKVLAMAKDHGGNENEKQAALETANRLMAAYGIAEAEIDMQTIDQGDMIFGECMAGPDGKAPEKGKVYRQCPTWAGILAIGVGRFTDSIVIRKSTEFGEVLVFQGEKNDVLFARWIFGVLIFEMQREQLASGWTKRSDSNSFRTAAASTLARRLRELAEQRKAAYRQAQTENGCRAIIVVERKGNEIAARFGHQRVKSCSVRATSSGSSLAGRAAGAKINIPSGRPLEHTGRKLIG